MSTCCYDVLVLGGGPAGAVTAWRLAEKGLRVAIVEKNAPARVKPGEVLTPNAIPALARLDLLDHIESDRRLARQLGCVDRTWGTMRPTREPMLAHPGGRAWVIDRAAFEQSLLGKSVETGVGLFQGYRVHGLAQRCGLWSVAARSPDSAVMINASFLVDATGRPAFAARRLRAGRRRPYRLAAIHAQLRGREFAEPAPPSVLGIEAVAMGWWYAVEGPAGIRTCTLVTSAGNLSRKNGARSTLLAAASELVNQPGWVESVIHRGLVGSVDASPAILDCPIGEGWLAVGDAAACFDPIASQGIPNALASGEAAAEAIVGYFDGESTALAAYGDRVSATWLHSVTRTPSVYQAATGRWQTPFWTTKTGAVSCATRRDRVDPLCRRER